MNKFQVGETVILQSDRRPDLNGEYTITEVMHEKQYWVCAFTGQTRYSLDRGFNYRLDVPHMAPSGSEILNRESSLRKKYEGSDDSFEEMMSKLKSPIKCGEKV